MHTRLQSLTSRAAVDRRPMVALGAWTAFLWVTRIKNAVGDSEMSNVGQVIAVATSVAFLVAAGVVTAQG